MKEGTHMQEKMIVLSMDAMVREDVAYLGSRPHFARLMADGRLLACAGGTYPLAAPRPGWAEQNPEDYWLALCAGARRAAAEAGIY